MTGYTGGTGGGRSSALFAITPEGERIEPDADGVLHCSIDDTVIGLCGGGGGRDAAVGSGGTSCSTEWINNGGTTYAWGEQP